MRFAEKEEKLAEKIVELEEINPRVAKRLGKVAERLKEKRVERMERVEKRIEKMGEKGQRFEQKKEEIKERIKRPLFRDGVSTDKVPAVKPVELRGGNVKIKNAKPGVMRVR